MFLRHIADVSNSVQLAQSNGWGVMTSHRSGETESTYIADLAVALRTGEIKTGAPCRSERMASTSFSSPNFFPVFVVDHIIEYNQLLRIEEQLQGKAIFAGGKGLSKGTTAPELSSQI